MPLERERFEEIITEVAKRSGDDDETLELIAELKKDYDERTRYTDDDVMDKDGVKWREKYDYTVERYRNRFFNTIEGAKEDQARDIKEDDKSTTKTFEELFKTREGDYERS